MQGLLQPVDLLSVGDPEGARGVERGGGNRRELHRWLRHLEEGAARVVVEAGHRDDEPRELLGGQVPEVGVEVVLDGQKERRVEVPANAIRGDNSRG